MRRLRRALDDDVATPESLIAPPSGIVSRANTARLSSTCPSWCGSMKIGSMALSIDVSIAMWLGSMRCSRRTDRVTTSGTWTRRGCRICRRLNASSCWVTSAARSAALRISSMSCRRGSPLVEAPDEQLRVAQDRRELVVEIVGDAAGEPADGVELLRFAQLLLEPHALRDVAQHDDRADHRAGLGANRRGAAVDAEALAVAAHAA